MSENDRPDFSRIYEAYHGRVLAYVTRLIGRDDAEDVTQEVFVRIDRSLGSLADASKLTSWIYAITLNMVRDTIRRRSTTRADLPRGRSGLSRGAGEEASQRSPIPDGGSRTPEEAAIRDEMVACYLGYVEQLPRHYRDVYVLSEFENLSSEEIARQLSVSPGTVKIRLHRARTRLNEELRRNCRCYQNERGELMAEPKNR
jgi:RNA polymerase sigma-70 factor (ECF subfamily)